MLSRFILLLLVFASVGLFGTVIDPMYAEIKELRGEKDKLVEALAKARELQQVHDVLEEKVSSIGSDDLRRLTRLLPDNVDNVRLVIDIEQIANRYGLTISSLQLEKREETRRQRGIDSQGRNSFSRQAAEEVTQANAEEEKPLQSIDLAFDLSSSYENFLDFLHDLESSLRLVDIIGLEFTSDEANFYDFKVTIRTYWLR